MYNKVLVAFDGSEQAYRALYHAVAIVEKLGSEMILLAVVPTIVVPLLPYESFGQISAKEIVVYQDRMRAIYHNILIDAEATVRLGHPDLKLSTTLMESRPSAKIVDVAEKYECDLIVIGSRRIGGIKGWIIGSTSRRVIDSCTKPILVVK